MSLPPQVNTDKSGKHRAAAMKEPVLHSGEVYYGMGPPALESSHSDSASSSAVYNPEKGPQNLPHYQQAAPVKWMHQDAPQAPGWSQEAPAPAWGQNFGPYMSGVNVRGQMAFHKGVHEGVALPLGGENPLPGHAEVYRDATQAQAQGRGLEWGQHAAAAMHQAQLQAYQHAHKGVELQGQPPHVPSHTLQGPMLQPFQTTFRPSKQQFSSGYYSVFPGNKGIPSLAYSEQPKTQQLIHQMQQQQQQMHHHHQQQQQQQLQQQQQHHLQLQQQQHLQQQQQQQQQIQQHQMQQQQLQQMQQYHQQQIQERQQQMQQMQQQQAQQQNVPQQETATPQVQPKQQQNQNFVTFQPPKPAPPDAAPHKEDVPQQEPEAQPHDASPVPDTSPEKVATNAAEPSDTAPAAPRRSRRLSRDGQSPLGPPSTNIWAQASKEPPPSQNGVVGAQSSKGGEAATGGVIRRRRRASKEINLETLAQKASEMEFLPAKMVKQDDGSSGRQATMVPLVIPVSVPVHRSQADPQGGWAPGGRLGPGERPMGQSDRKPSVIVARRRSLRNSMTESFGQDGESDPGLDEDGKTKLKRRPRPEPLIIPPPKPSTFIPPPLYSSITSYQSNLRSPVRLPDNPLTLPPYTPPPILSPVREGSGLYFSTFLTNIAVSNQILPPPPTPKSASRSLLRSSSSDITPPVLPLITDATPVSLEPRINIGLQYQADIPDLQDQTSSQSDQHKADLVWLPLEDSQLKHGDKDTMSDLMNMACCSVLKGGGTNQELVLHCLHECGGDFLETLGRLMLQDVIFPKGHHLAGYHYSGSDCWTADEKRYFNKGISAYRKDFFMVQKLVQTKTVAQCVEFYYTYKKQVKIGRNGILTFGPPDSPVEKHTEAVVDIKSSHQPRLTQGETDADDKKDVSYESSQQARVAQSLQAHDYAGTVLVIKEPDTVNKEVRHPPAPHRPRAEAAAKKTKVPAKAPPDPDAIFPCKKCGRVFYKVKSRSAHMKSHAEQEKKAAALRQREEEEQAAAEARARRAAAMAAAAGAATGQGGNGNGVTEQAEGSSREDSSEGEDDDDEDWH